MPIKQDLAWWCYANKGMADDDLMKTARAIGYTGLELLPPELFQMAHDNGLEIVTIGGHGPLQVGLNKRENFARIEAEMQEKIRLAQQWSIPKLIVFSGNREGQADEEGQQITIEALRKLAPMAEDAGILLILELLNSHVDHPDYMCDKTPWAVEVIKQVESPNVKILYDIYHMQIMEGNLIDTIRTYHPYFGHYHTAGVPGRHEINATQEINYPSVIQAIVQTGYEGYIGQEFTPMNDLYASLEEAYQLCDF